MTTVFSGARAQGRSRRSPADRSRPRRIAAIIALSTFAAAGLSACGAVQPDAIRVGNFSMSTGEFEAELQSATKNTDTTTQLGGAYITNGAAASDTADGSDGSPATTKVTTSKKWNPAFVLNTLNNVMIARAIDDEVSARKLKLSPLDASVKDQILAAFGGKDVFESLPKDYQTRQLDINREIKALIDAEVAKLGTPEAYFEKNKATFSGQVCASHILVPTSAEAIAAKDRIDNGEDFAKVADELTQDPSGKGKGGDLGCADPAQYVAEFAAAVSTLAVGQVGGPIQTQFGFHIIKVTKREEATFEGSKAQIESDLQQRASLIAQTAVFSRLTPDTVSVNPALGSLDSSGEFLQIVAPAMKIAARPTTAPTAAVQP